MTVAPSIQVSTSDHNRISIEVGRRSTRTSAVEASTQTDGSAMIDQTAKSGEQLATRVRGETAPRALESDVVARFSAQLDRRFCALYAGQPQTADALSATALGGQDKALADYIVARRGRYCLIEFKANEAAFQSEARKELRVALCRTLSSQMNPLRWARSAHFIGWGTKTTTSLRGIGQAEVESIAFANYPGAICPLLGFPVPAPADQIDVDRFIEMFLENKLIGSTAARFEKYLALLFTLAGSCPGDELKSIEGSVYVYIPSDGQSPAEHCSVRFRGLAHLFALTLGKELPARAVERQGPELERDRSIGRGGMRP
ncbi:hypothetical protein [Burkholderia cenocepacia]|uniref:hypothetical protein n=1 Tax=Burkholderia cenocepacia TaxID=95486 RepID=UPI0028B72040|nr:hypothetical protein [Burkholderia cenocepacia]MDT6995091.1 hypothetical protein [Burkholderia cenocepacia]